MCMTSVTEPDGSVYKAMQFPDFTRVTYTGVRVYTVCSVCMIKKHTQELPNVNVLTSNCLHITKPLTGGIPEASLFATTCVVYECRKQQAPVMSIYSKHVLHCVLIHH